MTDLFGESGKKGKKAKAPAETDGAVQRCIDLFFLLFVRKWNSAPVAAQWEAADAKGRKALRAVEPLIHGGKHGRRFKELVAQWGEDVVQDVERTFFGTMDSEVTRTDYGFDAFFRLAQRLRLRRQHVLDDRQRRNLQAAARASGRE